MGILEDTLKALERIPIWKRVSALPDEVAALERRVQALEAALRGAKGDQCPKCRAMTLTLEKSEKAPPPWGRMGMQQDYYRCTSCDYTDIRQRATG